MWEQITDLLKQYEVDTLYFEELFCDHWVSRSKLKEIMYETYKDQGMTYDEANEIVNYWVKSF